MELFFATLKAELINGGEFMTRKDAKARIFEYIEMSYNQESHHLGPGSKKFG